MPQLIQHDTRDLEGLALVGLGALVATRQQPAGLFCADSQREKAWAQMGEGGHRKKSTRGGNLSFKNSGKNQHPALRGSKEEGSRRQCWGKRSLPHSSI